MEVASLRDLCKTEGILTTGTKSELKDRLCALPGPSQQLPLGSSAGSKRRRVGSSESSSSSLSLQPVRNRPGRLFLRDAPPQRVIHGAAVELGGSQWQACVESDCLVLRTASQTDDKKERTACRIANIKHEVTTY